MSSLQHRHPFWVGLVSLASLAFCLSGCHQVTFVSARSPANTPVFKDQLNSAIVADAVDLDTPVRLDSRCESGWAKAELERSFFTVLLEMAGGWVYSGRSISLYCAKADAGNAASLSAQEATSGPAALPQ